jgi:hypothetical protein
MVLKKISRTEAGRTLDGAPSVAAVLRDAREK